MRMICRPTIAMGDARRIAGDRGEALIIRQIAVAVAMAEVKARVNRPPRTSISKGREHGVVFSATLGQRGRQLSFCLQQAFRAIMG